MNKVYQIILIGILILGCKEKKEEREILESKAEFNQNLVDELSIMVEIDQVAASNAHPPENYSNLTQEEWKSFKDSVYRSHQKRLNEVFKKYGFPGFSLVGENGSNNFWLLTQHADFNPQFQQNVLEKMKVEVDKENADPSSYGLLVDRVNLNTGKKQIYGTQLTYNLEICQAYPKKLADSVTVNERRKSIGLGPIEIYLNEMTEMHFQMNKEYYANKGITKPKLYKIE